MSIQRKILFGYFISVTVIGSMAAILLHERNRVQKIENETMAVRQIQREVNTAHRYITLLAMRGEIALAWEEEDSRTTVRSVCELIPCCKPCRTATRNLSVGRK